MPELIHTRVLPSPIHYDGSQLRAHWIFDQTGVVGDAIVAFVGGAGVQAAHMVDLEDRAASAWIHSEQMLHLIAEHFTQSLTATICLQRLLVAIVAEELRVMRPQLQVVRCGNDLFDGDAKLSVSIATASPVSTLIHFGINIRSDNTPVRTRGLRDYDIDPHRFADRVLAGYALDVAGVAHARAKVRAVS